jgi:Type II secretion system (T2SS), protein M subtype b
MTPARWLQSLSERDRRAVRLLIVAMIAVALFVFVIRPYVRTTAVLREDMATQARLLTRERSLVAAMNTYAPRLDRVEVVMRREAPRLFRSPDDVSGTAALASYVTDRASPARVLVRQIETRPTDSTIAGLSGLTVELRAEGDLEGVMTFLRALESGPRLVRVERLTLERVENAPSTATRAAGQEILSLAAMVRAYAPRPAQVRAP